MPVLTSAPNSSLFKRHTSRSCALITALVVPLIGALWIWGGDVSAQGLAPTRPGGSTLPKPRETTPEGPAEAAPEAEYEDVEPELPPLPPWPGQQRKKLQFFEIGGYLRFRADMQHNHNLGQRDLEINKGGQIRTIRAPFWRPLSENSNSNVSCAARRTQPVVGTGANRDINADDCPKRTLSGANMRLRLEPTINVAETVRVHSQVDIFDNLVLGSTPDSLSAGGRPASVPLDFLSESQAPPVAGQNSSTSAIVVKRAWAEVDTPVGRLSFGRMPWQWGVGLVANDGSCWDCNFGDNNDRIMFSTTDDTTLFGHKFGIAYDFAGSGPHSLGIENGPQLVGGGQAIDLEQLDDVDQLLLFVGRMDRPEVIDERLGRGQVVLNYGSFLMWRKQAFDYTVADFNLAQSDSEQRIADQLNARPTLNRSEAALSGLLLERHAWSLLPDLWLKLAWRKLLIEFEGAVVVGKIENASEDPTDPQAVAPMDILQYGMVLRSRYALLDDKLKIGLEMGMASGDDTELFDLNRRRNRLMDPFLRSNDRELDEFRFDNDYHVDLILFREIMGTVANAAYFKPWVQYDLFDSLGGRLDFIYSLAHKPVAYPGNSPNIGLEIDADLYYKNVEDGFSAGLQYGVLFPFGALDRPGSIGGETLFGEDGKAASIAQTIQARLIVNF